MLCHAKHVHQIVYDRVKGSQEKLRLLGRCDRYIPLPRGTTGAGKGSPTPLTETSSIAPIGCSELKRMVSRAWY